LAEKPIVSRKASKLRKANRKSTAGKAPAAQAGSRLRPRGRRLSLHPRPPGKPGLARPFAGLLEAGGSLTI
jgi:hypothetical protein